MEQSLAALAMGLLCLVAFADVATRYLIDISFTFTEEISVFLRMFLTPVGASSAFATGNQLSITILVKRLPAIGRKIAGISMESTVYWVLWRVAGMLVALLLVTFIRRLALALPKSLGYV